MEIQVMRYKFGKLLKTILMKIIPQVKLMLMTVMRNKRVKLIIMRPSTMTDLL